MRYLRIVSPTILVIAMLIVGCSGSPNPIEPAIEVSDQESGVPALTALSEVSVQNNRYLITYIEVAVDPADGSFEIIPIRQAEEHWNILKWLEQGPCNDCFWIEGISVLEPGLLSLDVRITHPFDNLKMTVFDLRGIAMLNGSMVFPSSGLVWTDPSVGDGGVMNAEGYSTLYNPYTVGSGPAGLQGYIDGKWSTYLHPNAHLNAYKRFISDVPGNTRNAFYAGDEIVVPYELKLPDGPFRFGYAVDASWEAPDVNPVTDPIADFPLDANCEEPWKLEVSSVQIGQGFTEDGGTELLTIDIYDWQGSTTITEPVVECPALFDGELVAEWIETTTDYVRYEVLVENDKLPPYDEYPCLVSVEDVENEDSLSWLDLTAYQVIYLEVKEFIAEDPVAIAEADTYAAIVDEVINFFDAGSYDPDGGLITDYAWDWENDGVFDEHGAEADHSWSETGTYYVQFSVTDDEGISSALEEPLEIVIVDEKMPPVAIAGYDPEFETICELVTFFDDGSYDPDGGDIVLYEWDWNNDGIYDEEGSEVTHTWEDVGIHVVGFRVTDDEGVSTELDPKLSVNMVNALPGAKITVDETSVPTGTPVHFSGTMSKDYDCDGEIVLYEWDFDDDLLIDDEGETVDYTWNDPGSYAVSLRVTDDEGATDWSEPKGILVFDNNPPTAVAIIEDNPIVVCTNGYFYAAESYDNDEYGESIELCEWDWDGDGTYDETGWTAYHAWDDPGTYNVQLRVTDDEGLTDELDEPLEVIVENNPPYAVATVAKDILDIDEPVTFDGSYSYDTDCGNQEIVLYEWDWDGDGIYEETGDIVSHSFSVEDVYYVQLRVTDDEGGTDTLDYPIEIVVTEYYNPFSLEDVTPIWLDATPVDALPDGDYVHVITQGPSLMITYSNTDPLNQEIVDIAELASSPQRIKSFDDHAFIGAHESILIYDISTPSAPEFTSSLPTTLPVFDLAVAGDRLYTLTNGGHLFHYDISDISAPFESGHYNDYFGSCIDSDGIVVYTGRSWSPGGRVYAWSPNEYGNLDLLSYAGITYLPQQISVEGNYMYATVAQAAFEIIDISDTSAIEVAGTILSNDFGTRFAIQDGYAFSNANWTMADQAILIIDIDPPADAHIVGYINDPYNMTVAADDDCVYAISPNRFSTFSFTYPDVLTRVSKHPFLVRTDATLVNGDYAYCFDNYCGDFSVLDISTPEETDFVSTLELNINQGYWTDIVYYNGYVIVGVQAVSPTTSHLYVFDVNAPSAPEIVQTIDLDSPLYDICGNDGYVYGCDMDGNVLVFDVDPPETASIVHTVSPAAGRSICMDGDILYIMRDDDLRIIDASVPESAYVTQSYVFTDMPYSVTDSYAVDGYLYVCGSYGLIIFDVDPVDEISIVRMFNDMESLNAIALNGVYMYVAGGNGLTTMDIFPQKVAHQLEYLPGYWGPTDVEVSGDYAYLADWVNGLRIIRLW